MSSVCRRVFFSLLRKQPEKNVFISLLRRVVFCVLSGILIFSPKFWKKKLYNKLKHTVVLPRSEQIRVNMGSEGRRMSQRGNRA